jgi:two-component system, NtrC family, response regulator
MASLTSYKSDYIDHIVGESPPILHVKELIHKVMTSCSTVLVEGSNGTGKELVAKAIHYDGPRRDKPFVAVNCSALAETLLESELFGHEKGAFTGAIALKKGRFELADSGTLFLDEIGELSLNLQVKLLRVIQERTFERVGGTQPVTVDVRIIAATNKNLKNEVESGRFRMDLYYRLNVFKIPMPPLIDRMSDIPSLADHFIRKYSLSNGKEALELSGEALEALMNYSFPGNVRELENALEYAVIMAGGSRITFDCLPEEIAAHWKPVELARFEDMLRKDELMRALETASVFDHNLNVLRQWRIRRKGLDKSNLREFLVGTGGRFFTRKEFAGFLKNYTGSDVDIYKTAGSYLKTLVQNGICERNGGNANKSRYRLSNLFTGIE